MVRIHGFRCGARGPPVKIKMFSTYEVPKTEYCAENICYRGKCLSSKGRMRK